VTERRSAPRPVTVPDGDAVRPVPDGWDLPVDPGLEVAAAALAGDVGAAVVLRWAAWDGAPSLHGRDWVDLLSSFGPPSYALTPWERASVAVIVAEHRGEDALLAAASTLLESRTHAPMTARWAEGQAWFPRWFRLITDLVADRYIGDLGEPDRAVARVLLAAHCHGDEALLMHALGVVAPRDAGTYTVHFDLRLSGGRPPIPWYCWKRTGLRMVWDTTVELTIPPTRSVRYGGDGEIETAADGYVAAINGCAHLYSTQARTPRCRGLQVGDHAMVEVRELHDHERCVACFSQLP
jgi:hypothetical protein